MEPHIPVQVARIVLYEILTLILEGIKEFVSITIKPIKHKAFYNVRVILGLLLPKCCQSVAIYKNIFLIYF